MTNSIAGWLRAKRIERTANIQQADKDPEFRAVLKERALRDPVFFFNQFAWTYDPRPEAKPNHFPFLTFPFQDDYIRELDAAFLAVRDIHTDKSRDMGVSWMVLTWFVWRWLKREPFNSLVGSRKEDYVDNYQPDSLFGKLDYQIRSLPEWMLPKGYNHQKNRTFCKIVNPETGNTLQGESANRDFSRAGRYSAILLDEFAFWEFADSVWTATADSTPVRVVVSTPRGKDNKFADLKFHSDIKKVSLHWSQHPYKDQEWYENEKKRRTPREIAQELDIDYEASGSERVFNLKFNQPLRASAIIEPFEVPRHWSFRGGLDYGTRNKSSFHVFVKDYDGTDICIFEWRRNMDDLKAEGFCGSMVKAIAKMLLTECPYYECLDQIRADPNLWTKNQSSPDGMTSLISQIIDEINLLELKLRRETPGYKHKNIVGFLEGAQSDIACIEVVNGLWSDPDDPQLKFFKTCTGIIEEYEELLWEEWAESQQHKRNKREKIVDRNNHSWDASKYYLMSRHQSPQQKTQQYAHNTFGAYRERMIARRNAANNGKLRS